MYRVQFRSLTVCLFAPGFHFALVTSAPGMVVYDRACKLHTYFLLREPAFIRNTIFQVDSLHIGNHTACSVGYDPRLYRGRSTLFASLPKNTQACEQTNAHLDRLKHFVPHMRIDRFMIYVRFFLVMLNRKRAANLGHPH